MHHSETPIPGTVPAILLIVTTGAVLLAALIAGLVGLAACANWLERFF